MFDLKVKKTLCAYSEIFHATGILDNFSDSALWTFVVVLW